MWKSRTDVDARYLGEFEHLVLLALLRRGGDAYGMQIWQELCDETPRSVSLSAVYTTLTRMESKGYVSSRLGRASDDRGGRRKKYFRLEPPGLKVLRVSHRVLMHLARGLEKELGVS